jgi:hypothetical protein
MIEGQRSGRNQTVQMEMIFERLIPGVQNRNDAQGSVQSPLAKLQKCFTDGLKQKTEYDLFVSEDQPIQFMG